MTGLLD